MKKTGIIKLVLCILAISAMLVSFAVMASAADGDITGGVIYKLNTKAKSVDGTKTIWGWNYSVQVVGSKYTAADLENLYAHSSTTDITAATRIDTGLRYDFDAANGVLTIYETKAFTSSMQSAVWGFPSGYMQYIESLATVTESDANYSDKEKYYDEGVKYFSRDAVKEIVIKGSNIVLIPEKALNYFQKVTKITIPSTLIKIDNEGCARLNSLRTLCVEGSGMDFDGVIDLRYITSQDGNSFSDLCAEGNHYVLLSEVSCKLSNSAWGNAKQTGTFYVFVPDGYDESCAWISSMKNLSWGKLNYVYRDIKFSITLCSYPSSRAVTEVGYQVRTSGYNGLRSQFAFDENAATSANYTAKMLTWDLNGWTTGTKVTSGSGSKVVYEKQPNGWVAQETSEASLTLKEWGTIAATEANVNAYGYALAKNGDAYVTADSKIVKVSNTDLAGKVVDGKFFVTIVNYNTQAQMTAPIFMSGYEIWTDETTGLDFIFYTANDAGHMNVSIYDVVIGSYKAGLINKSVESDNVFWNILDKCKIQMNLTADDITAINEKLAAAVTVGTKTYTPTGTTTFAYTTENGDLVTGSGSNKVFVSLFEMYDGTITAIAHPETSGATYTGAYRTVNWKRQNHLDKAFIGYSIDTFVFDDGFNSISDKSTAGFNEKADYGFTSSLTTMVFADINTIGGQAFHSDSKLTTVYEFDPLRTSVPTGVVDISNLSVSKLVSSFFSAAASVTTVKLPELGGATKTLPDAFFQGASALKTLYVGDTNVTTTLSNGKSSIDFTGTGYSYACEVNGATIGQKTKTFESASSITHVKNATAGVIISGDEGSYIEVWRNYGNVWTTTDPSAS